MIIKELSINDSVFLARLRSVAILIIVFGHVGGFWAYRPYSEFLHISVPIFFFLSGAVSFFSYKKSKTIRNYYFKKIINLIVPYYLVCILSLIVYVFIYGNMPLFDFWKLEAWLLIRAPNNIMPFPIGQVWFLYDLILILLLSPIYFNIYSANKVSIFYIMIVFVILSFVKIYYNVGPYFTIASFNFYNPFVFSLFFIFGAIFYSNSNHKYERIILTIFAVLSITACLLMVHFTGINIDCAFHNIPPDFYFVSVSFFVIFVLLLFRDKMVIYSNNKIMNDIFNFLHKHTFSIFLLHTFSIFISEKILGLQNPSKKNYQYGILKFCVVLIITCFISIPFTKLSNYITNGIHKLYFGSQKK